MNLRLLVYLRAEHGDSVVKIARPCYQFIGSKLFSTTALKYDKKSIREDDLSAASDPDVQFVKVPTKNLSVSSVDHIRAAYTDENPQASRIALMVHGAPGNHFSFRYLAVPLSEAGVRVIRINLPGFGTTVKPRDFTYTPVNKANFVVDLLQAIGIDKVDIGIGHCLGCTTITSLASTHPDFVSLYGLLATCGTRPHKALRPFPVFQFTAKLLEMPFIRKPTSVILKKLYAGRGVNVSKTMTDEVADSHRACANVDFQFNTKNLTLIGKKKLPVLVGYSLNDPIVENTIFNEIAPLLGLKTLPELATIEDARGKTDTDVVYDLTTGKSRQLIFNSGGHHIHKLHANYIAKALLETLNDIKK